MCDFYEDKQTTSEDSHKTDQFVVFGYLGARFGIRQ